MSRWREELCGKVVPVVLSASAVDMAPSSEVLSCGGLFLARPLQKKRNLMQKPFLLFLPKDRELLVVNPENDQPVRYGPVNHGMDYDELEVPDSTLTSLDPKFSK